jgi:hypothetical protein
MLHESSIQGGLYAVLVGHRSTLIHLTYQQRPTLKWRYISGTGRWVLGDSFTQNRWTLSGDSPFSQKDVSMLAHYRKYATSAELDGPEAGAPDELEITPEMIEAGASQFFDGSGLVDLSEPLASMYAERVLRAALPKARFGRTAIVLSFPKQT